MKLILTMALSLVAIVLFLPIAPTEAGFADRMSGRGGYESGGHGRHYGRSHRMNSPRAMHNRRMMMRKRGY